MEEDAAVPGARLSSIGAIGSVMVSLEILRMGERPEVRRSRNL